MEASAINTPHPDDEIEQFFGDPEPDDEQPQGSPAAADPEDRVAEATQAAPEATSGSDAGQDTPAAQTDAAGGSGKSGEAVREYIVFQQLTLNRGTLKALLDRIDSGDLPEPPRAFVEIHRETTRNDRAAISAGYKRHREGLGPECDLAAVSARAFKVRHVKPRQVVQDPGLSIT